MQGSNWVYFDHFNRVIPIDPEEVAHFILFNSIKALGI